MEETKDIFNIRTEILIIISIILSLFLFLLLFFDIYIYKDFFSIYTIAVLSGLVFQSFIISKNIKNVIIILFISFVFSFIVFIPFRSQSLNNYNLLDHISIWPFLISFIYIICIIALFEKKITPNLGEGNTLILTITICYWIIDIDVLKINFILAIIIICTLFLFLSLTIYNIFIKKVLKDNSKFILSIWTTIIMIIFGIEYIIKSISNTNYDLTNVLIILYNIFKFFLLGISSIYIANNLFLLLGFLPTKRTLFNQEYFNDIKLLRLRHIERYSSFKINKSFSLIIVFILITVYGLNYYFKILQRNELIILIFFFISSIIYIKKLDIL
jgi:hypothetical protein